MSSETPMHEIQFKTNKNKKIIIGNILKPKLIKAFRTKNKTIYSQRKIDVEPVLDL